MSIPLSIVIFSPITLLQCWNTFQWLQYVARRFQRENSNYVQNGKCLEWQVSRRASVRRASGGQPYICFLRQDWLTQLVVVSPEIDCLTKRPYQQYHWNHWSQTFFGLCKETTQLFKNYAFDFVALLFTFWVDTSRIQTKNQLFHRKIRRAQR